MSAGDKGALPRGRQELKAQPGQCYARLGMRRVVNAAATLTRLGGSLMAAPVVEAMADAAGCFVDMVELQQRIGTRLAELLHNDACYVVSGAASGITHAVAACIAGDDPQLVAAFPYLDGVERREVVIARSQRNGFDYAARQTGARIIEVDNGAAALERALSPRTACVLSFAGEHYGTSVESVKEVAQVAHDRGVPVLVDAAAQVPPISSLWRYTKEAGADAVIVSGGKGLRGPQSSGMVLGTTKLIEGCRANGNPNTSIGRPMKVGKEEMVGLLAAVEWYLAQDEAATIAGYEASVDLWVKGLSGISGVTASRDYPSEAGQPYGRAVVSFSEERHVSRDQVVARLWDGDPRIAVRALGDHAIALNAQTLAPGEDQLVLERLRAALKGTATP